MTALHVSVIVSRNTDLLESILLAKDEPFDDPAKALAHRAAVEAWISEFPDPLTAGQPKHHETTDRATLLAVRLPKILNGRDPALFGPYYEDPEAERAAVEHAPYDYQRLEAA